jgi:hypothetical protein
MEEIKPTPEQIEEKKKASKLLQEKMTRAMSKINAILEEEGMELRVVQDIALIPKRK